VLQLIAAVKRLVYFVILLLPACSVLAIIVYNDRFTIVVNYNQARNSVEIEKKFCCFSLLVLFIAQNIEITNLFFINMLYLGK